MVTEKIVTTGTKTFDNGNGALLSNFSLEVSQTNGAGASWVINLEGSLDGSTAWTPILTHSNASPGDGQIESMGSGSFLCSFRRLNVISLSLGSNASLAAKFEVAP